MAISTFSELKTAAANWLARDDLTSRIPEFITLAEAKMNRDLASRHMECRAQTTISTSSTSPEFITLPGDFRSMRWVRLSGVSGKPHLDYMSPVQLTELRTSRGNASGEPVAFTILATEMEICPSPDANYVVEMVYRRYVTALSDAEPTNWLLTLAPDLYLYGTLCEAEMFTGNDPRVALWRAGYNGAVDGINKLHIASAFNAGPVAMRVSGVTP